MADAMPFRFSTKYQDDETDLLYYGYRYYNASTGRWLSRDPVGERGGVHLYGFVNNESVLNWDYLGLEFHWEKPWTSTLLDPIPDPEGDIFGSTAWHYFNPHARPYQPLAGCPCGTYKVFVYGYARVVSWWVEGDKEAETHERTHINTHHYYAYEAFKENAEYHGNRCMPKGKATCIAKVIETEMRNAYVLQAYATGREWDCMQYGGKACTTAKTQAVAWASALEKLQNALQKCETISW